MHSNFLDTFFYNLDSLTRGIADYSASTVDHNCMLETTDSDHAFSANNASLVSLFEFEGALSQIGEEFDDIIEAMSGSLGSMLSKPGRSLQIVYNYDPDQTLEAVEKITQPSLTTAKNIGLDLEEIITDWNKTVSQYCAVENCYIAAWTRPDVLSESERKNAFRKMNKACKGAPAVPGKQNASLIMSDIRHEHDGMLELLSESFKNQDLSLNLLNTHEAMHRIRRMTCPEFTSKDWKALLPGDPLPIKYPDPGEKDFYGLLLPGLASQLFPREAIKIDRNTIQIGDTLHRPLIMTLPPQNPKPFQRLFRYLSGKRIAYRCSITIEPDGLAGQGFKNVIASVLAFTSTDNKKFKDSLEELKKRSLEGETIVKIKMSFDTWVDANQKNAMEKLSTNASILAGAIQAWGTCDSTECIGDPLLGVCATIPCLMDRSPAPAAAAPLEDVIKMMPMRPLSAWNYGSLLLRTPDGKLMPYAPLSSKQASWLDIGFGSQGVGKSSMLLAMNLAFILQPGLDEMPYLFSLDIGASSSGLISLLKYLLPEDKKYLAAYHRIRMEPRYAINPFDTELGSRRPMPSHISFLVNLLSLFATPLDQSAPGAGMAGLARTSIERAYDNMSDDASPKPYTPGADPELAKLVERQSIHTDKQTTWWEIVDALFDAGFVHEAIRAQRHAVPLLSDVISACHQSTDLEIMYTKEQIMHFTRSLAESIQAYPILKEPTRFDISDARVVSLDLAEVAPGGGATAKRQTAVMYMLGRQVLVSRFYVMPEDAQLMPQRYRSYHAKRIDLMQRSPKRQCCDEIHRVSRNSSVANQFVVDLETASRESRKLNLSIGLYSQNIGDIPEIITELASTVFVMGTGTKKDVKNICDRFGFNEALAYSMANLGKPSAKGAKFVAMFKTSKGTIYQTLTNTIASLVLPAFSSTSEDMNVRDPLYDRLGVGKTLRVLSRNYPDGIKREIERRKLVQEKKGFEYSKNIYDGLIDELVELSRQ